MKDIRQDIAINIYNSGWLLYECKKICPNNRDLHMDLFQEIMLIVLTYKPDGPLLKAYEKGEHLPFIKRIIMNNFNSKTSPFYKKYKLPMSMLELIEEITKEDYEQDN